MKQSVRSTHCLLFISCTLTVQTPSGALGLLPNQTLAIATSRNCDFLRRWKLIGACFLPAMAMFVFYPLKDMFATEKKTKNFPYCVRLSENMKFWQPGIGLKDFGGTDDAKEEEEKEDDIDEIENTAAMKYPVKLDDEIIFQRPCPKDRYCICQNRNDSDSYIACIRGDKCVLNGWVHSECVGIPREAVRRLRNLWVCPVCVLEETKKEGS